MSRTLRVLTAETGAQILANLRQMEFIIPTLVMPAAFYTLFAVVLPGSSDNAAYLLASFGIFAVLGPAVFGFGVSVANERERGWLQLKRVVPAPAGSYVGAKLLATLLVAAIALAEIYAIAGFVAGVELERSVWFSLLGVHLMAAIPFVFIGLIIGFFMPSNGAVAVSNIVFLGLSALGGLWIPIMLFPPLMQTMASYLPSYHLAEIALAVSGAPGERDLAGHLTSTLIMTGLLGGGAVLAWANQRS